MKIKTGTTVEITKAELHAAVKIWLLQEKGIEVHGELSLDFIIKDVYDDSDWQGKYGPIGNEVIGAKVTLPSQERDA